ncbi:MAG: septal ring lytic transglycosylase RlpA family protein [Sorangiineae bacterium]|nr:septal ring lytic transglycosylase RlpA family protein [Polyangiaceae bacterium]MEB2322140.1 septal ring lytic transglycosylase RlpA family protein [Sorangiineae bacterium]
MTAARSLVALVALLALGACRRDTGELPPVLSVPYDAKAPPTRQYVAQDCHDDATSCRNDDMPRQDGEPRGSAPGRQHPAGELASAYARAPALTVERGQASYYSDALAGRATASGERYEPRAFTAAHRTLPFGAVVRVTREPSGPVVYVRVTDRGPFGNRARIIDLSRAAAEALDMIRAGVAKVRLEVVALPGPR